MSRSSVESLKQRLKSRVVTLSASVPRTDGLASHSWFIIPSVPLQGPWVQKKIANPDFYEDSAPLTNIGLIGAVAFEVGAPTSGSTLTLLH